MDSPLILTPQEAKKLPKPNNIIPVKTHMETDFFKDWCIFLKSFINLTPRETDVMASFLRNRWILSKSITDPAILDATIMSKKVMNKVMEDCHMTQRHFYVIMNALRNKKVIVEDIINPKLIPNIRDDGSKYFQLLILFKEKEA